MNAVYAIWRGQAPPPRAKRTWDRNARVFIPGVNLFIGSDDMVASLGQRMAIQRVTRGMYGESRFVNWQRVTTDGATCLISWSLFVDFDRCQTKTL